MSSLMTMAKLSLQNPTHRIKQIHEEHQDATDI